MLEEVLGHGCSRLIDELDDEAARAEMHFSFIAPVIIKRTKRSDIFLVRIE